MAVRERISIQAVDAIILMGPRAIVTATASGVEKGQAVVIPSSFAFGEAIELRFSSALSNTQFQGIFLRVDTSVANTSTIRAAEFGARQGTNVAVGTLEALFAEAQLRGNANVTSAFGLDGQISMFSDYTGTVTNAAALRGKFQTEDGATLTNGYGLLLENEAVTGGLLLDAAVRVESSGITTGFDTIIDSSGTLTTVSDTDRVRLWTFQRSDGTPVFMKYDTSDNALIFNT